MDGLKKSLEGITPKKMQDFKDLIKVLSEGTGKFMKSLALTAIIAPVAFIGAKVFALILTGLTKTFSKLESMEKETLDGIKSLMSMAKGIALFSLTMLGIGLLAPRIAIVVPGKKSRSMSLRIETSSKETHK
jgi:hypothetical protein